MNRPIAAATVPTGCPVWLGRCTADRTDAAAAAHFGFRLPHRAHAALEDRLRLIRDPRDQEAHLDPRRRGRAPTLAVASLLNQEGDPPVPRAPVRHATIPPNAGDNPREVLERRLVTTAHDRRELWLAHPSRVLHRARAALEDGASSAQAHDQEATLDPRRRGRVSSLAVASVRPRDRVVPRPPRRHATIPPNAGDDLREVLERRLVSTAHDRRVQPPLAHPSRTFAPPRSRRPSGKLGALLEFSRLPVPRISVQSAAEVAEAILGDEHRAENRDDFRRLTVPSPVC